MRLDQGGWGGSNTPTARKNSKDRLFIDVVGEAVEFHKRRLWKHVDSNDPISIRVEGQEHPLLVFILGSGGFELGISVLRGDRALATFEDVVLTGGQIGKDRACEFMLLSYEMPSNVNPEFLRTLERSGRIFGKNSAAPVFLSGQLDGSTGPMTRPELRLMLEVMRTLMGAADSGLLVPRPWDSKRRTLELTREGKGKNARVIDSVVTWEERAGRSAEFTPGAKGKGSQLRLLKDTPTGGA